MAGPRIQFTRRTLILVRAILNPYTGNTVLDGTPVTPSADNFGVLYTRSPPANGATGILQGQKPATRQANSNPAVATQATASLAASGGVNPAANIAVLISWACGDTAASGKQTVNLRDGASGLGTILWTKEVGPLPANGYAQETIVIPVNLGMPGTNNTAMTLEFAAAPSATGFQSVAIFGEYVT